MLGDQIKENNPFEKEDSYWARFFIACPHAEGTCCDDEERKRPYYRFWADN
jgi:hypothetical protein